MNSLALLFALLLSAAVMASKETSTYDQEKMSEGGKVEQASFTENAQDALDSVKESLDEAVDTASETANSAYSSVLSTLLNGEPANCEDIEKEKEREACEKAKDQYSVVFV